MPPTWFLLLTVRLRGGRREIASFKLRESLKLVSGVRGGGAERRAEAKSVKREGKSGERKVRSAANRGKVINVSHQPRRLIEDFVAARETV